MSEKMKWFFIILFCSLPFVGTSLIKIEKEYKAKKKEIILDTLSFSLQNLDLVLTELGVKHKDIVIKQFILETGWGKSYSFKKRNNLFGLTNPRTKDYFSFDHWTKSVKGYKNSVQYKYKGGDYYEFLKNLPYAEDPKYISKLKHIKYDI